MPRQEEKFTEFYILGPEGKARGYPDELTVGEETKVILRIVNHEHEDVSYHVEIAAGGSKLDNTTQTVLGHGQTWEREVFFTPIEAGEEQKIDFILCKNAEPYRRLHLWVNVKEQD